MRKTVLLSLITLLFLSSCTDVYRDFQSISGMRWFQKDKKNFDVKIKENGNYDLIFSMRYPTGFQYKNVDIKISRVSPDGKTIFKEFKIKVRDENGYYIGSAAGDLWDLEQIFSKGEKLENGNYKYTIEHISKIEPLMNVMDIGLIIRHSEK